MDISFGGHTVSAQKLCAWAALAAVAPGAIANCHAQQGAWKPERAVEIVVPTTPGGGQTIAMNHLDQRAGDGHELLVSTMSLMTNHILGRSKVNYTDYTPLAVLFGESMTLVVRPDSPIKAGRDIQERLKSDPRSMSIAIGIAVGGTNHLALALVIKSMGIDVKKLKTVVFQSNGETMTALMGGHVDLAPLSAA